MKMLACFTLLLAASAPLAAQSERQANLDAYQEYPRWYPQIHFGEPAAHARVDVGPDGVAHIVAMPEDLGGGLDVAYYSDRFETRTHTGFSAKFVVDNTGPASAGEADLAVTPAGTVHVMWVRDNAGVTELCHRQKDQTGWSAVTVITTDVIFLECAADSSGNLHALGWNANGVLYWKNPHTGGPQETVSATGSALEIAVDSAGDAYVTYLDAAATTILFRKRSGGVWGGVETVATGNDANGGDIAVDPGGNAHVALMNSATFKARYTRRAALGGWSAIEDASVSADVISGESVKIAADSRNQPHMIWHRNTVPSNTIGYAVKLGGATWAGQEPIGEHNLTIREAFPNDLVLHPSTEHLYFVTSTAGTFSRTFEPNLGGQDSFTTFPWGPNSSANGATGNVNLSLPLSSSRGVGFATGLSLVYNSLDPDRGPLGPGWSHNYHMTMTSNATGNQFTDVYALRMGDSRKVVFRYNETQNRWLADADYATFSDVTREFVNPVSGKFFLTTKFGITYTFDSNGRLEKIEDTQSPPNTITFAYTSGRLTSIVDSAGRSTGLQYDTEDRLIQVTDAAGKFYDLVYEAGSLGTLSLVKFSSGPGIPTWKFEHHAQNDAASGAKKGMLSRIYTPRGQADATPYFWSLAYWPDGRAQSSTEPSVLSIANETDIDATPAATQAVRDLAYTDPAPPFNVPHAGPNVPSFQFTGRRDFATTVEYEYKRALADKVTDAQTPTAGVIKRYFDGYNFATPASSVPGFRNLIRFTDARGNSTNYTYFTTATPAWVKDNLQFIDRPLIQSEAANRIEYTYTTDGLNRVATVKDARLNTTSYNYNAQGNLTSIVYPIVNQCDSSQQVASESFTYDSKGRVLSSTDAENNSITFQYNDPTTGLVTHIYRPGGGNAEVFGYDAMGNTTSHTLPVGGTTSFALDGIYRVDIQTDPLGRTTDFDYDLDSNVIKVTDSEGNLTNHVYDKIDRLLETTTPAGTSKFEYDREGNVRKTQDPNAVLGSYYSSKALFDEVSRAKLEHRRGDGAAPLTHISETKYDLNGNVTERTLQPGTGQRKTTFAYDARNNLTDTTHPIATLTDHNCYDENDNLAISQRKQSGVFLSGTGNSYDERNRLKTSTQLTAGATCGGTVTGPQTCFLYNKNGSRTKVIDPLGKTTEFVMDSRERHFQTKDGSGIVVSEVLYTEDDLREFVKSRQALPGDPLAIVRTYLYNTRNELVQELDAFSNITAYTYTDNGNLNTRTDPAGLVVDHNYDSSDRLSLVMEDPTGLDVRTGYTYDANSNRKTIAVFNPATGLNDAVHTFNYDSANRLISIKYPLDSLPSETWIYNALGELATHTDRNGKTVTYTYDDMGRLTFEVHGAPFNRTIQRIYDGAGNLLMIDDGTVKIDYTYDALNRMLSASWTISGSAFKSISYTYDDAGNRATMTDPEGVAFTYGYDANNRPTTIVRAGLTYATTSYYAGGQRKEIALGNGSKIQYSYDKKDRLTSLRTVDSGGSTLARFDYTYDSRDNRTRIDMVHLGTAVDYTYDILSRLKSEGWTGSTCVAPVANLFTSTPAGNESGFSNEVAGAPQAAVSVPAYFAFYSYDKGGNRTEISALDRRSTYSYDAENRLTSESPQVAQKVAQLSASASDTETGHSAATASDGVSVDSTSSSLVWKSTNSAGEHSLELAFQDSGGAPLTFLVGEVKCYLPTTVGGVARMKPQYWTGTVWQDLAVLSVSGASSAGGGWYSSSCHEVTFGFSPISTQKMRYLQDAAGGGSSPNVAYLNELEAFAFVSQAAIAFTYDTNGNLKTREQGDIKETYGHDYANRVASYTRENTATVTTLSSFTYLYAPTGDRVNKDDVLADKKEWYMLDGSDVVTDYTQDGANPIALQTSYVQSLSIDSKIARITAAGGATHYYVPDALGSVHAMLDSSQSRQNLQLTTAWGEPLPGFSSSQSLQDRYGFTQREKDSESSLMHFRARAYDPRLGRFVQTEPLLGNRATDHYTYAANSPTQWTDPTGRIITFKRDVRGIQNILLDAIARFLETGYRISVAFGGDWWSHGSTMKVMARSRRSDHGNLSGAWQREAKAFLDAIADDKNHGLGEWLNRALKLPGAQALFDREVQNAVRRDALFEYSGDLSVLRFHQARAKAVQHAVYSLEAAATVGSTVGAAAGAGAIVRAGVAARLGVAAGAAAAGSNAPNRLAAALPRLQRAGAQPAFATGRWLPHFMKHGSDFPYASSVQYLRGAQNLVAGGPGVQTFVRASGDRLFYRVATNEFAVLSSNNVIRTYFKPTEGVLYWLQQTGQLIR